MSEFAARSSARFSLSHKRHEGHLGSHIGDAYPKETLDIVVLRKCPQGLCDRLAYARFPVFRSIH